MATAGAPPKFSTVEELSAKIEAYFKYIEGDFIIENDEETGRPEKIYTRYWEPATITGLALFLGFESRQSFYDYKGKKQFSYTIARARTRIENEYEKRLTGRDVHGVIFALKNLGWMDKQQTELTGKDGGAIEAKMVQITGIKVE